MPAMAQAMPKGGTLKIAMRVPKIDNPATYSWIYDSNILRQVCGYMSRTGVDNVTRPHLLEKWSPSEDLKTWTLGVRDVKWHKGKPLTAQDLAWNIAYRLKPETGSSVLGLMSYMVKEVDTGKKDDKGNPIMATELWDANAIEVVDDKTLKLNLKEAQIAVPEHLFHYPFGILDPEEGGKFGAGSNGTEAFELAEVEVGRRALLKARNDYYGDGPYLDAIEFIDLGDNPAAVAAAIASKQVDGIYEGNIEQLDIYKQMPDIQVYDVVTADTCVARMQVDHEWFKDPKVRQAVRYATDQKQVLDISHRGLGAVAEHHHVAPVLPDYAEIPMIERDLDKAKALLAEAGHADGIDIEIYCKPDPSWEQTAVETMVSQWKDANIRAKINVVPSAKYWEVWNTVPMGFTSWVHRPLGTMTLALAYRANGAWNESKFNNPEFESLLTKAEGTLDITERKKIMAQIETLMQNEGPLCQPIWRSLFVVYDKKVKGFQMHPTRYIFGETLAIEG